MISIAAERRRRTWRVVGSWWTSLKRDWRRAASGTGDVCASLSFRWFSDEDVTGWERVVCEAVMLRVDVFMYLG